MKYCIIRWLPCQTLFEKVVIFAPKNWARKGVEPIIAEYSGFESIPSKENEYVGFVYAVEFGDKVKFGHARNPRQRIKSLDAICRYAGCKIGRIAVSGPHLNFKENERILLATTNNRFGTTELYSISFDEATRKMKELNYEILTEEQYATKEEEGKKWVKSLGEALFPLDRSRVAVPIEVLIKVGDTIEGVVGKIFDIVNSLIEESIDDTVKLHLAVSLLDLAEDIGAGRYYTSVSPLLQELLELFVAEQHQTTN